MQTDAECSVVNGTNGAPRARMMFPRIARLERHSSLGLENIKPAPIRIRCVGNYDLGRTIGKGQFGKVKLATHVLTGETVNFFYIHLFFCS